MRDLDTLAAPAVFSFYDETTGTDVGMAVSGMGKHFSS